MRDTTKLSKLLAYVLRHNPDELGLELDAAGWTDAEDLLQRLRERRGIDVSMAELAGLVEADQKGRYSLRDGRIRANQGHSVEVDAIDPTPRTPPELLYHGTTAERWERIQKSGGLRPMQRHHVHLSDRLEIAQSVGARHRREQPVILVIAAQRMYQDGHVFLLSENQVWLADAIPSGYLRLYSGPAETASGPP